MPMYDKKNLEALPHQLTDDDIQSVLNEDKDPEETKTGNLLDVERDAAMEVLRQVKQYRSSLEVLWKEQRVTKVSSSQTDGPGQCPPGPEFNACQAPPVISILGNRGSGKTTTLLAVVNALCRQSGFGERRINLVTKLLDTESVMPESDPLGWVLASLDEWVSWLEGDRDEDRPIQLAQGPNLRIDLEHLVRMHHGSRNEYLNTLAGYSQTAAEYSEEVTRAAQGSIQFGWMFRTFVVRLLSAVVQRETGGPTGSMPPLLVTV